MAGITILPREQAPGRELSEALGSGLQTGLGGLLNQLAEHRGYEMQANRTAPALKNLLNLTSPEEANAYALLGAYNPNALKSIIASKSKMQFPQEGSDIRQFIPGMSDKQVKAYNSLTPGEKGIILRSIEEDPARYIAGSQQQNPAGNFQQPQNNIETGPQVNRDLSQINESQNLAENIPGIEAVQKPKTVRQYMAEGLSKTEANNRVKEDARDKREERKIKHEQEKLKVDRESEGYKYNKDLIDSAVTGKIEAKRILGDLDRLEELEGGVDTAGYAEFLKRSGLDIPALMNPESEEYNKIIGNFQRGAREIYGGRISNFELESFMKTIPSLSMSPEGRKRVTANLKRLYRDKVAFADTMEEIIDKDGGAPLNLRIQIGKKLDKRLEKTSEQFRKDLAKPVPKGQNKLVTALQASAGTATGRIPKALSGAGVGALLGSRLGVPGAIGGGVLGGLAGFGGFSLKDLL